MSHRVIAFAVYNDPGAQNAPAKKEERLSGVGLEETVVGIREWV